MKKVFLSIFIFISVFAFSQKRYGTPLFHVYKSSDYHGHPQSWYVTQLSDGRIAIGSSGGILFFDGNNFENVLSSVIIRTIYEDTLRKRLYVGGDGVFGYIYYDSTGYGNFIPLSDSIPKQYRDFLTILGVYAGKDFTVYSGMKRMFIFKSDTLYKVFTPKATYFYLFEVNDKLYTFVQDEGVVQVTPDSLILLPGTEVFSYSGLNEIVSYNDSTLLIGGARPYKLYLYSLNSGKLKELPNPMKEYFLHQGLTSIKKLKDGNFVIGTYTGGTVVLNKFFNPIFVLNSFNGLPDNYVSSFVQDNQGNIWVTSNNGFYVIYYENQSFKVSNEYLNLNNIPTALVRKDKNLFVATLDFAIKLRLEDKFARNNKYIRVVRDSMPIANGQIMDIVVADNDLLLCGRFGVFLYKNDKLIPLDTSNIFYKLKVSNFDRKTVFAASVSGLSVLRKYNGKWNILNNKIDIGSNVVMVFDKTPDTLFLISHNYGFYKVTFSDSLYQDYKIKKIDVSKSHVASTPYMYMVDDTLFSFNFEDTTSTLWFDAKNDTFVKWHYKVCYLNGTNTHGMPGFYKDFVLEKDKDYIMSAGYTLTKLRISGDTIYLDNTAFRATKTEGIFNVYHDTIDNLIWSVTPEAFYNLPTNYKVSLHGYNCLITQVKLLNDSIVAVNGYNPYTELPYKLNDVIFSFAAPFFEKNDELVYSYILEGFDADWSSYSKETFTKYTNLPPGAYIFKVKAKNIYGKESKIATYRFTVLPPWYMTWWAYLLFVIGGIGFVVLIVHLYSRRLKAANERLERLVNERTKELKQKNEELQEKNTLITHSIEYAKKIQDAILPTEKDLQAIYPNSFILFYPRDIVSGDFFWFYRISDHESLIVVSDCTGHGVPGAFMSMIGNTLLNEIVKEKKVYKPSLILENIHEGIINSLQTKEEAKIAADGMDMVICKIDTKACEIHIASANQNAFFFVDDEFVSCYGDPYSIGDPFAKQSLVNFSNFKITYKHNASIYLTSDGYFDQFGGHENKKFTITRFINLLKEIKDLPMQEQKKVFEVKFKEWKNDRQQIDDILIVGIKIGENE